MPITELENKKPVTVSWVTPKLVEEGPHKLLVNKTDNVEQLLEVVRSKVKSTPARVTTSPPPATPPAAAPANEEAVTEATNADTEMKDVPHAEPAEPEAAQSSGKLRLIEVFNNRVSKVYENTEPVKNLNDYSTLYAEEIPADQIQVAEEDQLVNCFHFHKDPYSSHGIPFLFLLKAVGFSSFFMLMLDRPFICYLGREMDRHCAETTQEVERGREGV